MRKTLLASLVILCAAVLVGAVVWLRPARGPRQTAPVAARGAHSLAGRKPAQTAATTRKSDDDDDEGGEDTASARRSARATAGAHAAPVWTVDKAASRLSFRGTMNGAPFDGVFKDWDAQIAFDPRNLATSRATITVDTTSALTGEPIKDQALPNSEWLATQAYPQATLVTRNIAETSPGHYLATADVHIRGVAWRTTVPFTVAITRDAETGRLDTGRMDASISIDRRTFGIGEGPFRSPAPVEPVVQVSMKLLAEKSR